MTKPKVELERCILLRIARELGPELDQIDVVAPRSTIAVRELVVEFTNGTETRPVEVRMALAQGIRRRHLSGSRDDLLAPETRVGLTMRGLLAARELEPGCGLPTSRIRLEMRNPDRSMFDARIVSGQECDRDLNRSGLCLAALYVFAVRRPTAARPLMLADTAAAFARLAELGIGPRSGRGDRMQASPESIGKAIRQLRAILRIQETWNGRHVGWYLTEPFPEVELIGESAAQFRDWTWMLFSLAQAIAGSAFLSPDGSLVNPPPAPSEATPVDPKASTA